MFRMQTQMTGGWVRTAAVLAIGLGGLLASGCATTVNGTTQRIAVDSTPSGAQVYVQGRSAGTTPLTVELERSKDYTLRLVKEGYEETNYPLARQKTRATMGNIWLGGLIGFLVDAITGSDNEFVPAAVHADLRPVADAVARDSGRPPETAPPGQDQAFRSPRK